MKKLFLFFIFLISINLIFSQEFKNKNKIIELLGEERYEELKSTNLGMISYLNAKVDFGFQIIDAIPEKENEFKELNQIPILSKESGQFISPEEFVNLYNSGNLNILLFNFQNQPKTNLYYKIGNTNKYLIIYSVEHINSNINR